MFFMVGNVFAKEKTLGQLKAEAEANRAAYNEAKSKKAISEAERNEATAEKTKVQNEINTVEAEIEEIEKQVESIKEDIEKKDAQMKDIMGFVQVSNGEENYLEYIFGATDFTDFIYRVSVAEQLNSYNQELIDGYNKDIERLDAKQKELEQKQNELTEKERQLSILEAKLNKEIEELSEGMLDKDREYKTQIDMINNMISKGCSSNETLTQCTSKKSSNTSISGKQIPSTNGTYMPILRGRVTSDYGWRNLNGRSDNHQGIDFSNGIHGDNIYPVAPGEVVYLSYPSYNGACGNHIVYVKHNINGHSYVTSYWHMTSFSVSKGQMVTQNTVLGKMGGLPSEDSCAGGTHVHLNLFENQNGQWERSALNGRPNANRINPRILMPQIPAKGVYFTR